MLDNSDVGLHKFHCILHTLFLNTLFFKITTEGFLISLKKHANRR
jgi:hypothetical protein